MEPVEILTEQVTQFYRALVALTPNIVVGIVLLVTTFFVARGVRALVLRLLKRSGTREALRRAVGTLTHLGIWILGLMIAATVVFPNLTPSSLVAGLGIGSIAIGLAFRDTFENFLAGFLILMRKSMRIGDDIECEGLSGQIEEISIRDTFLRQRSGELVIVPNSFLFKNPVNILTDKDLRRISVVVGVAYGEDVAQAQSVIETAIASADGVDGSKPPQVFATTFNSSSIDFMVRWWAESTPLGEHRSRSAAVIAIKSALDEAGIEIPFPYRTHTFAEPLQVVQETAQDPS